MKKCLKALCLLLLGYALFTLAPAPTFVDAFESEKYFFTSFFAAPKDWIGTIVLWKYVVVFITFISIIIAMVVCGLKCKCGKKHIKKQTKDKKVKISNSVVTLDTDGKAVTVVEDVDVGIVMSNNTPTSHPGRFIRVNTKK